MTGRKIPWVVVALAVIAGVAVNLPPIDRWIERASEGLWPGLPWVLLAVLWLCIGIWAYVQHKKRSNGSMAQG